MAKRFLSRLVPVMISAGVATATAVGFVLALAYTSPAVGDRAPTAIDEVVVYTVNDDLSAADPQAPYWRDVREGMVTLTAQPWVKPRPETTTTERIFVKAVTNGKRMAFRLRWSDTERSEAGRLGEHSDAMALQFPVKLDPLPSVAMGAKGMPVHIFHWRAQYQRDRDEGKPMMKDIYPNVAIDMYPMDFREAPGGTAADKESFSPGRAAGNPQSYEKTGVDEVIAEGFATSSVQAGHSGTIGHGEWKDGEWTLVVVRPLAIDGGSTLEPKGKGFVAFAAWQGGMGEVASRKSLTMSWIPVVLR